MKIEAATRLKQTEVTAAQANVKKAEKYLTEIGFTGLEFKTTKEDAICFKYEKYDAKKVAKHLGAPKGTTKSESIRYGVEGKGVVSIWPGKGVVWMGNSAKNIK
jgi:hypothetical protein